MAWCNPSVNHRKILFWCLIRLSLTHGQPFILAKVETDILAFIFLKCKQGIAVSMEILILFTSKMYGPFQIKTKPTQYYTMRWFVKSHSIVKHVCTHLL